MPTDPGDLLEIPAVAKRLGVSVKTVNRLTKAGDLPSLRIGARRLYDPLDVAAFIAARRAGRKVTPAPRPVPRRAEVEVEYV